MGSIDHKNLGKLQGEFGQVLHEILDRFPLIHIQFQTDAGRNIITIDLASVPPDQHSRIIQSVAELQTASETRTWVVNIKGATSAEHRNPSLPAQHAGVARIQNFVRQPLNITLSNPDFLGDGFPEISVTNDGASLFGVNTSAS